MSSKYKLKGKMRMGNVIEKHAESPDMEANGDSFTDPAHDPSVSDILRHRAKRPLSNEAKKWLPFVRQVIATGSRPQADSLAPKQPRKPKYTGKPS